MTGNAGFTGNIPQIYDQGLGPMIFVDYAAEMARRVAALAPTRVLETAAGTGIVTRKLRDALPAGTYITATDLNPPMLEIARTKFADGEAVTFQRADALSLPFDDNSFDAVVCQFGIMFFPDRDQAYREVFRVLKPGGHYFFSTWDSHAHNPNARIGQAVVERIFPVDPPPFYRIPFSCSLLDPIRQSVTAAGFTAFEVAVVSLEKVIPEAAVFAHAMVYGNPLGDQVTERGGDAGAVVTAITDALHLEFGPDPGIMPLQAIMFQAKKV